MFVAVSLLGNVNVQHAVLHFRLNLVGVGIIWQNECLLKSCVGELSAQVTALLVLLLLFVVTFLLVALVVIALMLVATLAILLAAVAILLHCNSEVVLAINVNLEIVFAHTGCCNLNLILLLGLKNIDGWCGCAVAHKNVAVEKIVEDTW